MSGRHDRAEERIRGALGEFRAPDEGEALDRAVALASAEHSAPPAASRSHRRRLATGLAATGAALAAAFVLTPAGAAVRDWIGDAVDGAPQARPSLGHLPSGGALLVQSEAGPWVVSDDGARRLLGDYDAATWSPRGLYVAVSAGRTLSAVDPGGDPRWSIDARSRVRDARWSTSGQRIAYRSGGGLSIVAGDGTGNGELVRRVAPVAPTWMPVEEGPLALNSVAFVDGRGRVVAIDADSGRRLVTAKTAAAPLSIDWYDRDHILVVEPDSLEVIAVSSGEVSRLPVVGGRDRIVAALPSPDGEEVAILKESGGPADDSRVRSALSLVQLASEPATIHLRTLFAGPGRLDGPLFSPDGSRILLGWRQADQWLFIDAVPGSGPGSGSGSGSESRAGMSSRLLPVADISPQFDPGSSRGEAEFPTLEGWCCG